MLLLLLLLQGLDDEPIQAIKAHRAGETRHWLTPAAIAAEVLESGKWQRTYKSAGEFLTRAAASAGYEVNSFRRQVRCAAFLKKHLGEEVVAVAKSAKVAVSAVEMLARLHEINPEAAAPLLRPVLQGERSFVEIREIYNRELSQHLLLRNSLRTSVKARSAEFQKTARACVMAHLPTLFSQEEAATVKIPSLKSPLPFARLDFILTGQDATGAAFAEAVDCRFLGLDNARSTVIPLLQQSSLLALQFRRVWLAFPMETLSLEATAETIHEIVSALQTLHLVNVGVLLLDDWQENAAAASPQLIVKHAARPSGTQSSGQQLLLKTLGHQPKRCSPGGQAGQV